MKKQTNRLKDLLFTDLPRHGDTEAFQQTKEAIENEDKNNERLGMKDYEEKD